MQSTVTMRSVLSRCAQLTVASLITGRYPLSMGFTNCKNGLSMRLKDEEIGVGQMLKDADYQTAYIGKWHLDEPEQNHCRATRFRRTELGRLYAAGGASPWL